MFNLKFRGVASTPVWCLELDEKRAIEFAPTTTKTATSYLSFVQIAENLPEVFDALSAGKHEIFEKLLPHFVELMGVKQCVFRILKVHGFDIDELSESYATISLKNRAVRGMYQDGTFYWMKALGAQLIEPGIRSTGGSEILFKSVADDDFDWSYIDYATGKKFFI